MKKILLLTSCLLIVHGGVVMGCTDRTISPTGSATTDTSNFQTNLPLAEGGCTLFLTGGTFVLNQTIKFTVGFVTITPDPPDRGDVTIQAGVNDRNNLNRYVFVSQNQDGITIDGINFIPLSGNTSVMNPPDTSSGRAVWKAYGGSNLTFSNSIVTNFTDGLFHCGSTTCEPGAPCTGTPPPGLTTGGTCVGTAACTNIHFLNNALTLADYTSLPSDPTPSYCRGGNAGFTVNQGSYNALVATGNTAVCPGPAGSSLAPDPPNLVRDVAIVGLIVFNDAGYQISDVHIDTNVIHKCDHGVFVSSSGGINSVKGNRLEANTNGVTVGVFAGRIATATGYSLTKNVANGNGYDGAFLDGGTTGNTLSGNVLNGNKNQCFENFGANSVGTKTGSGTQNICRGPGNTGSPGTSPGKTISPGGVGQGH